MDNIIAKYKQLKDEIGLLKEEFHSIAIHCKYRDTQTIVGVGDRGGDVDITACSNRNYGKYAKYKTCTLGECPL